MALTAANLPNYVDKAIALRLSGYQLLLNHTTEQILECANGIGPQAFPSKLRNIIDRLNPTVLIASIIHDLRFTYGTGDRSDFLQANADLETNSWILAEDFYGWYNPLRYWVKFKAHEFRKACDKFGWSAYQAAIELRKQNPAMAEKHVEIVLN